MKNLFFLIALFPSVLFAQQKEFTITGHVTGLADGEVKLMTTQQNPVVIATDSAKGGVFRLTGSVPEPGLYFLVMSNEQPQYIFLDNVAMTVKGAQSEIKKIKIEGSQTHSDFVEFNAIFNPMFGELNALAAQIQKENQAAKREKFINQYDSLISKINGEVNNFVSAKRSSFVSPFLLWVTSQTTPDIMQLESNFNLLDTAIRNSQIGKALAEYITVNKVGAVGTEAVDFTQNDTSGKAVSLSSFRGKYVLVDFWASWCRPCRIENPNLVKAYNKYKDKNFTILGVSLDQEKDAWTKAIQKDGLAWSHVSDLQYWNNAAATLYRIQSIPGNMLIDPQGKIVAKDLHGPQLEKALAQYLGATDEKAPANQADKKSSKTSGKTKG